MNKENSFQTYGVIPLITIAMFLIWSAFVSFGVFVWNESIIYALLNALGFIYLRNNMSQKDSLFWGIGIVWVLLNVIFIKLSFLFSVLAAGLYFSRRNLIYKYSLYLLFLFYTMAIFSKGYDLRIYSYQNILLSFGFWLFMIKDFFGGTFFESSDSPWLSLLPLGAYVIQLGVFSSFAKSLPLGKFYILGGVTLFGLYTYIYLMFNLKRRVSMAKSLQSSTFIYSLSNGFLLVSVSFASLLR